MASSGLTTPLPENELEESFCRSGGPGGQNVNKVNTAVFLRHLPSGVTVRADSARSQEKNRQLARARLAQILMERRQRSEAMARAEREKEKRRNRRRPRGLKERILRTKRVRSAVKKMRGRHISES